MTLLNWFPPRKIPSLSRRRSCLRGASAFSLVELLVVVGIISILLVMGAGPALNSISGAGSVNRAITDVSGSLEFARAHAMANNTYVRVAIATLGSSATSPGPRTVLITIASADGTLETASATDMQNPERWPMLGRPQVLDNILVFDSIDGSTPDTSSDRLPSESVIPSFSRNVGGGSSPDFQYFIQFSPNGEAGIGHAYPERHVKLAFDQPNPGDIGSPRDQNPFILRLSGINGTVTLLRKGEGI